MLGLVVLGYGAGCREQTHDAGDGPTMGDSALEGSREARQEAARLSRVIDRLREADNTQKQPWLKVLQAEPCKELCALKQVCESAYREHVSALDAIREVQAYGTAIPSEPGVDEGVLVAAKLEEAERKLQAARELSNRCVDAQGSVKLRLKL